MDSYFGVSRDFPGSGGHFLDHLLAHFYLHSGLRHSEVKDEMTQSPLTPSPPNPPPPPPEFETRSFDHD